jgi:hypothetical protein
VKMRQTLVLADTGRQLVTHDGGDHGVVSSR